MRNGRHTDVIHPHFARDLIVELRARQPRNADGHVVRFLRREINREQSPFRISSRDLLRELIHRAGIQRVHDLETGPAVGGDAVSLHVGASLIGDSRRHFDPLKYALVLSSPA